MCIALLGKNRLGFVDRSYTHSAQLDSLKSQWDKCNAVVLFWIINSVDKDLLIGLTFSESSSLVWKDLPEQFDKRDAAKIYGLYRAIYSLSQGTLSISQDYTKLKDLWDKYASIMVIPTCHCQTSKEYARIVQDQKPFQFLMGLSDSYHQTRSHILLLNPLPSVNQAYAMVS